MTPDLQTRSSTLTEANPELSSAPNENLLYGAALEFPEPVLNLNLHVHALRLVDSFQIPSWVPMAGDVKVTWSLAPRIDARIALNTLNRQSLGAGLTAEIGPVDIVTVQVGTLLMANRQSDAISPSADFLFSLKLLILEAGFGDLYLNAGYRLQLDFTGEAGHSGFAGLQFNL